MALNNIGRLADYIEILVGKAGINRDSISREQIFEIINSKLQEFAADTGIAETSATMTTVTGITQADAEYDLPDDKTSIIKVTLDGLKVHKMRFRQLEDLQDNVS